MDRAPDRYAAFRLNLDQQRKRAKDLLRAVRDDDAAAWTRVEAVLGPAVREAPLKLTAAQLVIARELGLPSWQHLRAHVAALTAARAAIETGQAPDARPSTFHVRCGSDIQRELTEGGFTGDFLSLWDPLVVGPIVRTPDWVEKRAVFLSGSHGGPIDVEYATLLEELSTAEARLTASPARYGRVVIWMEHDSHDQLALIRVLARYVTIGTPGVLELISINRFPGAARFIGLGQLPREALRMLWRRRVPVGAEALSFAAAAWDAVTATDPRQLAVLARRGSTSLPDAGPALQRHLRELPSVANGLSLTQSLTLALLSERTMTVGELFHVLHAEREPLPFLSDVTYLHIVRDMTRVASAVVERRVGNPHQPLSDRLTITPLGDAVLRGVNDWMSLRPPVRWLGGVTIDPEQPCWRWSEDGEVRLVTPP